MAEIAERSGPNNTLGEIIQSEDVSAVFIWLSSDDVRFVTGIKLPVAAGATAIYRSKTGVPGFPASR